MKGKKIFRCMPVLVALCVLLEGMFFMTITKLVMCRIFGRMFIELTPYSTGM